MLDVEDATGLDFKDAEPLEAAVRGSRQVRRRPRLKRLPGPSKKTDLAPRHVATDYPVHLPRMLLAQDVQGHQGKGVTYL